MPSGRPGDGAPEYAPRASATAGSDISGVSSVSTSSQIQTVTDESSPVAVPATPVKSGAPVSTRALCAGAASVGAGAVVSGWSITSWGELTPVSRLFSASAVGSDDASARDIGPFAVTALVTSTDTQFAAFGAAVVAASDPSGGAFDEVIVRSPQPVSATR